MTDSFKNVRLFWKGQVKASTKCLAVATDSYEKDGTTAKSSFVNVENAEIRKHPRTVMITVECCNVSFSSLLLYKTNLFHFTGVRLFI